MSLGWGMLVLKGSPDPLKVKQLKGTGVCSVHRDAVSGLGLHLQNTMDLHQACFFISKVGMMRCGPHRPAVRTKLQP